MKMIVQEAATASDMHVIEQGLIDHAHAAGIVPRNYRPLVIFLYDEEEQIVGGIVAATVWGWLHVKEFWIAEQHQRHGWGAKLLALAEREASDRQCHHGFLDTFDFQALGFYQKQGYTVFGSLADFPEGHTRYFVQKPLPRTDAVG